MVLLCFALLVFQTNSEPVDDKEALLDFIDQMPHLHSVDWRENTSVCTDWTGVTCNAEESRVVSVRLPGIGFNGPIPANTLSRLSELQILSLRSNRISGPFPSDFTNLKNLSMLFLQFNELSGPLPSDFSSWKKLLVINLSSNMFNGSIPESLSNLTQLVNLKLSNNSLSGEIPDLDLPNLQKLDLSYNNLSGVLPSSLEKFPSAAFVGNSIVLPSKVPPSLIAQSPISEPEHKAKNSGRLGKKWLEVIVICVSVLGVVVIAIVLIALCSRKKKEDRFVGKFPKGELSPGRAASSGQDAKNRLVFFEGCSYAFDLEDLLRASAEVLGKGTYGMSYKAILEDANVVVVKRLKDISVGKREFEQQMGVIGSIRHENVVALRAYYYSKDEKLMVSDHCGQGNISTLLHDNRGEDRTPLDWKTRLSIAIGAARGIAHIHEANGGKLVHGNIRSSNIFLNPQQHGCVSDFGLATIMGPISPPISRATGYRAPEITDTRKSTHSSDVYSFGVFLLELLTGKSPIHSINGDELVPLVRWVHSVVREEWTAEVFDIELMRYPDIEEEMVEMLQIAMSCAARAAEQRPKMADVVRLIENVPQSNG
ncbi:hypothetical protein V2J09_020207 [Rumex salicifolius]